MKDAEAKELAKQKAIDEANPARKFAISAEAIQIVNKNKKEDVSIFVGHILFLLLDIECQGLFMRILSNTYCLTLFYILIKDLFTYAIFNVILYGTF